LPPLFVTQKFHFFTKLLLFASESPFYIKKHKKNRAKVRPAPFSSRSTRYRAYTFIIAPVIFCISCQRRFSFRYFLFGG
jgi:hypothetical protein